MINQRDIEQPFIFTVISGKGGVGKSMTSVNTAEMLGKMGYRVALIDADIGLSNCATLLNEPVVASVSHWIEGKCRLEDLMQDCGSFTLITGSDEPGHEVPGELLMDALDQLTLYLSHNHDFIIIDTPAGAGEMTLWGLDKAHLGVIVLVDEPTAISDVYRLCKYVYNIDPAYSFAGIVNFAENEETADSTYQRFNTILNYFLQKQIPYLGFIPASQEIRDAVQQQNPVVRAKPDSSIFHDLEFISQNLIGYASNVSKQPSVTVR